MDSKTIYLKRQSSDTMLDLSQKIMDDMRKESPNAEVVVYNIEHVGEAEVLLLGFEKYYYRIKSCASVVIQCIHVGDKQVATVSGLGGGNGRLLMSWGANEDFANIAAGVLKAHGFH